MERDQADRERWRKRERKRGKRGESDKNTKYEVKHVLPSSVTLHSQAPDLQSHIATVPKKIGFKT